MRSDKNKFAIYFKNLLDFRDDVMQPAHDVIGYRHKPKPMDAQPTIQWRMKYTKQVGLECRKKQEE